VQVTEGATPVVVVDQVVPVGDLIVDGATGVTIRDAAIHAPRGLIAGRLRPKRDDEFTPVAHAIGRRLVAAVAAIDLKESGDLTH